MSDNTAPEVQLGRRRREGSIRAEAAFRARLEGLGATLLDPWLGNSKPHRAICVNGHSCTPRPSVLQQGSGPCRTCAGTDPKAAEAAFRARVAELGGRVLEATWRGVNEPHRVLCHAGHECAPRPNHVRRGKGLCLTCAGQDTRVAEARFRECVAQLGGTVTGPWRNTHTAVHVRCQGGHACSPVPTDVFRRGGTICRTCGGRDPEAAWAAFRLRVEALGGRVLESAWKGALSPHQVQCAEGHKNSPRPNDVQQGQGICYKCRGRQWDAFYVVQDDIAEVIKFGVTSGDVRPRLYAHARDGLDRVVKLAQGLPQDTARELERTIASALRDVKENPVRGREYFHARALPLVLDLVDNHPAIRPTI